jgi:hypothetical protein
MAAYPSIDGNADTSLRGFLKWQFMVGNQHPLTDSFIPMWCLTPARQDVTELGGYFEWRFNEPLLLPPGARIDAQAFLQANTPNAGGTPTVTVAVAYAGQLRGDLNSFPDMVTVPFCSAWDTTVTGAATSNDWNSLRNPLRKAVDVDTFVARSRAMNPRTGATWPRGTRSRSRPLRARGAVHRFGPVQFHAPSSTTRSAFLTRAAPSTSISTSRCGSRPHPARPSGP